MPSEGIKSFWGSKGNLGCEVPLKSFVAGETWGMISDFFLFLVLFSLSTSCTGRMEAGRTCVDPG